MSSGHDYRDKCCTNIAYIIIIVIIYDNIVALCGHKAFHMYMEPVVFFVVVSVSVVMLLCLSFFCVFLFVVEICELSSFSILIPIILFCFLICCVLYLPF